MLLIYGSQDWTLELEYELLIVRIVDSWLLGGKIKEPDLFLLAHSFLTDSASIMDHNAIREHEFDGWSASGIHLEKIE